MSLKESVKRIFGGGNNDDDNPIIRERSPDKSELALGYALGEEDNGDKIYQLKGVSQENRNAHFYIVGASTTGKTKFIEYLIRQDIANEAGFGVIDPHGDLVDDIKNRLAVLEKGLNKRVVLIDPTDEKKSVCFNPLEITAGVSPAEQAGELVLVFKKIWKDAWGDRMADILRNSLICLIEKKQTLAEMPLLFRDAVVRDKLTRDIQNEACKEFFEKFEGWNKTIKNEWTESTLNKISAFLQDDRVRRIFSSPKSSFNLREIIDSGKILLVKLDKGRLKESSDLLGSLLLSKIQMAAFSRTDIKKDERKPFYLYIDEFQNFATDNFIETLAESAKYKLSLILAHQNLSQLTTNLRASLLSNCGLQTYFRVSRFDAEILAKEAFAGVFDSDIKWEDYYQELQSLPPRVCVVKNKIIGGVVFIRTPDVFPIEKEQETNDKELKSLVKKAQIGRKYLLSSKKIDKDYQERRKKLLANDEAVADFTDREAKEYEEIIKGGESNEVEFKETIRFGYKNGEEVITKLAGHIITKAISSFLNSEGGKLFIGVRDNGEILGIERDYTTLPDKKKNKDGFLLHLTQIINNYISKEFNHYIRIIVAPINGKDICVVSVGKSKTPVYLKNEDKKDFYIRMSASSYPLDVQEATDYIKTHFPKY